VVFFFGKIVDFGELVLPEIALPSDCEGIVKQCNLEWKYHSNIVRWRSDLTPMYLLSEGRPVLIVLIEDHSIAFELFGIPEHSGRLPFFLTGLDIRCLPRRAGLLVTGVNSRTILRR